MRPISLLLLSTVAFHANTAVAAEAAGNDVIVVTATGTEQPVDEVGQAITVLDAATITKRQAVVVADLILTTPGVRINRNGSTGGVTGVSLRGAETTQTLVLIDGVKVNDPSGIGDLFDFGALMVGNIRRIEVLRGSNSVAYGSQAIGGVVNVVTGTSDEGVAGNAQAEYGSYETVSAKADISGRAGMFEGGAGITWYRTDGISDVDRRLGATERDDYENFTANSRMKIHLSDAVNVDLRGYYIHADKDYDSFFGTPADSADVSKSDQYIGYAGLNAALFDGMLTNRFAVTYFRHDRDYYFARANADPDFGYRGESRRYEYQGVLQPGAMARLIFGYEHERPEYSFAGFGSNDRARTDIDSFYGLAVVQPIEGLSLTAGARHDDHKQFGGATTIGANANWAVTGSTRVRLSYGEGFKAPSLYQLYDPFSGTATLRPEQSKSYDAGLDQQFLNGAIRLSATYFRRDTHDQINFDNTSFTYGNLDRTRTRGMELEIALRPTDTLSLSANYSHLAARDRSPGSTSFGNRLARRANDAVNLSVDQTWASGLSAGATITMVGDSFDDLANTRSLDGYVLVGLRASAPIGEHLEIYARADNLFDEHYQTAGNYGSLGRAGYVGVRLRI